MNNEIKRICRRCGTPKSLDQFGKDNSRKDGLFQWCKSCQKEDNKKYRAEHKDTHAKQARIWRKNNIDKARDIQNRSSRKHRINHADKAKARSAVTHALRDGRLFRKPCETCGSNKSQAHHDDYSKPLDVRWLCKKDHDEWHRLNSSTAKG